MAKLKSGSKLDRKRVGIISSHVYDGPQPTNLDHLCQKIDEVVNYSNLHCNFFSEALYTSLNKLFLSVATKIGLKSDYCLFFRGTRPLFEKIGSFCAFCLLFTCFKVVRVDY